MTVYQTLVGGSGGVLLV